MVYWKKTFQSTATAGLAVVYTHKENYMRSLIKTTKWMKNNNLNSKIGLGDGIGRVRLLCPLLSEEPVVKKNSTCEG